MRPATVEDLDRINLVSSVCGFPSLDKSIFDGCLVFIGEYGYVVAEHLDDSTVALHITVTPSGRGKWAVKLVHEFMRWLFTATTAMTAIAKFDSARKDIEVFAKWCGFNIVARTSKFTYAEHTMLSWLGMLKNVDGVHSDYEYADSEMEHRAKGACEMMARHGMSHKGWYVNLLYAKLFGYLVED